MTTLATNILETPRLPLDRIRRHQANPRLHAVADTEMVDSILHQGILEPLMVAPDPLEDGMWVLIDGHRREDGARRAGLTDVPVTPRPDLVTEAQQIEVMIVTGLQKQHLTPVEEAAAYEQLTFLGMDAASIAASTGFGQARVKARLKLNALSSTGRDALHAGDLTLLDAEALLEFADDTDAVARLEAVTDRPGQFRTEVHALRATRERVARNEATIAEYVALGAESCGMLDTRHLGAFRTESLAEPGAHPGCLGYYHAGLQSYYTPELVCTNPKGHTDEEPVPSAPVAQTSDWEKQREARAVERARQDAATAARLEWLGEHFTGMFPTKSHQPFAAAMKVALPLLVIDDREVPDSDIVCVALGLGSDFPSYRDQVTARSAYAAGLSSATPTTTLGAFARFLAAMVADQLAADIDSDLDTVQHVLGLWDWMKAAGYPLSDVDRETRNQLEVRLTALLADEEDN